MFNSLLIANRGEIACRIIKTAKKMGIETHAIFHQKDFTSPHRKQADYAHEILGQNPNAAYLNSAQIISIIEDAKIEAVHPGYGFLSEDSSFPKLLEKHRISYIGPRSESVALMGDKIEALNYARTLDISTLSNVVLKNSIDKFISECKKLKFPIMLKLSGAGGGRGIKIIDDPKEIKKNVIDLNKEKERNFGSSNIFAEEYIANPRHIEVQIIGDGNGNIRHLFERECSIQRRYQKIIEETPAQHLSPELRKKLCEDACKLAGSMNYLGVGTVEFLLMGDNSDRYFFLEMNTRIQVEHGVTEEVCSLDLVEKQIEIAYSKKFDFEQKDIKAKGHAIEARICCEAFDANFTPRIGKIEYLRLPNQPNIRVDFGANAGQRITPDFDSMIGKLISYGRNRAEAIDELIIGLSQITILGCETNINALKSILRLEDFASNQIITTNFVKDNMARILDESNTPTHEEIAVATLLVLKNDYVLSRSESNQKIFGWQNRVNSVILLDKQKREIEVKIEQIYPEIVLMISNTKTLKIPSYEFSNENLKVNINDESISCKYQIFENQLHIKFKGDHRYFELPIVELKSNSNPELNKSIKADMPGTVIAIKTKQGAQIKNGEVLMVVESMKIQTNITSKVNGTIKKIYYSENESFERGSILISL